MKLRNLAGFAVLSFTMLATFQGTPSAAPATARLGSPRLVLASTRAGFPGAYSVRPDGSRLTPLLRPRPALEPLDVSRNGRIVVFRSRGYPHTIYVSRADGTGLHRVISGNPDIDSAVLSPDGRRLALTTGQGIVVIGSDGRGRRRVAKGREPAWSPDGKALVYVTVGKRCAVAVQPLRGGSGRVLARGGCLSLTGPKWSPDGRHVAYEAHAPKDTISLWVVGSGGSGRHRVAYIDVEESSPYSWSPGGTRLAFTDYSNVFVVGVDGGAKRLPLEVTPQYGPTPMWTADGRRLLLSAHEGKGPEPDQIWAVGLDGSGPSRLTSAGENVPLGWTRLVPVLPPAAPTSPSEHVLGPRTVATRKPVTVLSADHGQVAFAPDSTATDCQHVDLWSPGASSISRVSQHFPAPCSFRLAGGTRDYSVYELSLAGAYVAWSEVLGCGNFCDVGLVAATLPDARPLELSGDSGGGGAGGGELTTFNPRGDGDLLVFNAGDSIVQIGQDCTHKCKVLRTGAHTHPIVSVSGHLVAVQEPAAVAVLDQQGSVVSVLPFGRNQVKAVRLDGARLVVVRSTALEVYDATTGAALQQQQLPVGYVLSDVDGGVALLRHGREIYLLRLVDGASFRLAPSGGPVLADLEDTGLYYSYSTSKGAGRLVFVPRSELDGRLGANAR
jgi:hypothetical protein